jgi:hypothetical protein
MKTTLRRFVASLLIVAMALPVPAHARDPVSALAAGALIIVALPLVAVGAVVVGIARAIKKGSQGSSEPGEQSVDGGLSQPEQVPASGQ